jgi:quinohemoprotein amine dehydrogenase
VLFGFVSLVLAALAPAGESRAQDAQAILAERCTQCHTKEPGGTLSRISYARKTPEAWFMTIVRMEMIHGLEVTNDERRALVKYLADTQGLAPSEAQGFRYILEREPNVVEVFDDPQLKEMCARCHSGARVALERRVAEEWTLLMHFHLGQFPTTEYQALGRDREWFKIALEEVAPKLAAAYPLETAAWRRWQEWDGSDLAGAWRVAGSTPGRGMFFGTMTADPSGDDTYAVSLKASYGDGSPVSGDGSATVYTGYEWRATLTVDGVSMRQVFAATPDGLQLSGRMFETDADEIGSRMLAVRDVAGSAVVMAVEPGYIRAGSSARLTIIGTGMGSSVSLGEGVTVDRVIERRADRIVVEATAAADAAVGSRTVIVGGEEAKDLLAVYHSIDAVKVEPAFGIARVGGNGATAAVKAAFEAVAYAAGPDGEAGTEDDVRIGVMPAEWSVAPFDEVAATLEDVKYAGAMDAASGLFTPAEAGLNPERPYSTNNAGNLKVIGTVTEGDQTVSGEGQLIVTVQRWNDPPIR